MRRFLRYWQLSVLLMIPMAGCATQAQNGALVGGGVGAGLGAIVGHATGNTAAGAAIGAGVGALAGASIGAEEDRNRALIASRYHVQVSPGAVTVADVINMTQAHVEEGLIINQIQAHGMAQQVQSGDLIALRQQNVSPQVIAAMQTAPQPQPVVVQQQPVYVETYGDPYYHRHYYHPYYW
jgi:hypothetical protein